MKRTLFVAFWFGLMGFKSTAQTLNDPIYFNFSLFPKTNFDGNAGQLRSNFWEFNASAPPISIGKKLKWFNSVYYRNSQFDYNTDFTERTQLPDRLHDIRYTAIFRFQLNTKWELVALPRIMLRSDLVQSISGNDLFPQVAVLATYAVKGNPNFKIGLGGALNNDFERNAFVPLGSLYYNSKKFKAELVYPNANFLIKHSSSFEYGLFASVDGAISRINPTQFGASNASYLRSFQLLIAPTASFRLHQNFFAHLKAGVAPVRSIEALDADFEKINNKKFDLEAGLFFRAGISYRLPNN